MSAWTNERHEATRELVRVVCDTHLVSYSLKTVAGTLGEALDEIERLRALTTITKDRVRAAAREFWLSNVEDRVWGEAAWDDMGGSEPSDERALVEIAAERALEAALTPKEN